jgi:ribosomal protein S18 acetylase RimI-like enzyme
MSAAQVRDAHERDCSAVCDLIVELRCEEQKPPRARAPIEAAIRAALDQPASAVFVAESGDAVVGFIVAHWIPFPMVAGTEAYISDLIVAAGRRGAGIGRSLVDTVERHARERGCVRIMLNNHTAAGSFQRGFYRKLGYRHREEFANFVKVLG